MKHFFSFCTLAMILSGCLLWRSPQPSWYTLEVGTPERKKRSTASSAVLSVTYIKMSSLASGDTFSYRVSETKWEKDYDHLWITPLSGMLTNQLRAFLRAGGSFKQVTASVGKDASNLLLECSLVNFYVDFRDPNSAKAVVTMRGKLWKGRPFARTLLFIKTYSAQVPCASKDPASFVQAWNAAFQQIFYNLQQDILRS